MNRDTAIVLAMLSLMTFLKYGEKSHGITHRYSEGRWDIYSFDIGQWHVLLSDNGGELIDIIDASGC